MSTPVNPVPTVKTGPAASTSTTPSTPTTPPSSPGGVTVPPGTNPGAPHTHMDKVDDPSKPATPPATPTLATGATPPAPAPASASDTPVNDVRINVPQPGHNIGITKDGFNPLSKLVVVGDILEFNNHDDKVRRVSFNQDLPDIEIGPKEMKRVNVEKTGVLYALSNGKQAEFQVLHTRK